ncbi:MAG: PilZ domain-containing protein [Kofleriaceae bacterium]|nr:PilZ domain-containing protein [Kofleriaceae bacterium]
MRAKYCKDWLARRRGPRIPLESICSVTAGNKQRHATVLELSSEGLRLERPFDPQHASRTVSLEIEIPQLDEIIRAQGHVRFARLTPMGGTHPDGSPRFWCQAGIKVDLSSHDRRFLYEYVGGHHAMMQSEYYSIHW